MDNSDEYEHYNYDDKANAKSGSRKGLSKKEVADKQQSNHSEKEARKVEEQITNAEQKQKEKLKKQSSKD